MGLDQPVASAVGQASAEAGAQHGLAVHPQHLDLRVDGGVEERPGRAEPGRGDVEADVEFGGVPGHGVDAVAGGQVGGQRADRDGVSAGEVGRQFAQQLLAPGDQHEIEPCFGELPGDLPADPGRRSGDHGAGAVAVVEPLLPVGPRELGRFTRWTVGSASRHATSTLSRRARG